MCNTLLCATILEMIKIQGKLPRKVYLACSGGVDSMAVLDFLRNKHEVVVLHFDHSADNSRETAEFVHNYCEKNNILGYFEKLRADFTPKNNKEDFWRKHRYSFLDRFTDAPVITCHHLDDCVETWVWSSLHGEGKIVPYRRKNVIRPFRLNRKRDLALWAAVNNIPFVEDDSNNDLRYTRNYIRHEMMPNILRVNPGIYKTIKKKVIEQC